MSNENWSLNKQMPDVGLPCLKKYLKYIIKDLSSEEKTAMYECGTELENSDSIFLDFLHQDCEEIHSNSDGSELEIGYAFSQVKQWMLDGDLYLILIPFANWAICDDYLEELEKIENDCLKIKIYDDRTGNTAILDGIVKTKQHLCFKELILNENNYDLNDFKNLKKIEIEKDTNFAFEVGYNSIIKFYFELLNNRYVARLPYKYTSELKSCIGLFYLDKQFLKV